MTAIDSGVTSGGTVILAEAIQRRLERGTTMEEVDALVERFRRTRGLLFTVETLEYLVRGGRVGKASGLAGQLLSVKPILHFDDGEVAPLKRVRGRAKALAEFERLFLEATEDSPDLHVGVGHAARARGCRRARRAPARRPAERLVRPPRDARPGDRHPRRPGHARPLLVPGRAGLGVGRAAGRVRLVIVALVEHVAHWDEVEEAARGRAHRRELVGPRHGRRYRVGRREADRRDAGQVVDAGARRRAREEIFFVLGGSGLSWQDGETYEVRAGDCLVHLRRGGARTRSAPGPTGSVCSRTGSASRTGTVLPRAGVAWMSPGFVDAR